MIANFVGSAWMGIASLIFLPVYLSMMGAESFALIGLFVSLINIFTILDLGLSPTLNRELARYSAKENSEQDMADVLRTLETIYWPLVLCLFSLLLFLSPWIANEWLQNNQLPTTLIIQTLYLISGTIALHMLTVFYGAGLLGLQLQVLFNKINVVMITLRYVMVVPVLYIISPSPIVFFAWQVLIGIIHLCVIAYLLWHQLLPRNQAKIRIIIFKKIWVFSSTTSAISILGVLFLNMDKVLLSKWLSLEEFGYYTIASILAMSIAPRIASPFFTALYPRFSQCIASNSYNELRKLYCESNALLFVVLLPISMFIIVFSGEILHIWTGNIELAGELAWVLSLLSIGALGLGCMYIPYALQLSSAWTYFPLLTNVIALIIVTLLMFIFYNEWGVLGVALAWCVTNLLYIVLAIPIIHNKLLDNAVSLYWYKTLFIKAVLPALAISLLGKIIIINIIFSIIWYVIILAMILCIMLLSVAYIIPESRNLLKRFYRTV
ncbi:MAG: oligosaccharide flippase family protein [Mariprofundales bacterium]